MNITPKIAKDQYVAKKRQVGRSAFILACFFPLFFFNFEIGIVDLLPDFIGVLFLLPLLSCLRDLGEKFEAAYKKIKMVALLSLGKFVSIFLVFGLLAAKEGGYSSSLMMFGLVFAVLDIIFVTDAFRTFFDGVDDLAQKYDCEALIKPRGPQRKNRTESVKRATVVFIIARSVCAVLPEVSTTSAHTVDDSVFPWANYTGLFRVFGAAVCLIFGAVWLVRALRWFIILARERTFCTSLAEDYALRLPSLRTSFILRDSFAFCGIISLAAFLCIDIFFEQNTVNCLPDALCALLLAVAAAKGIRLFAQKKKLLTAFFVSCSAWGIIAIAKDVLHYLFYKSFSLFAIYRDEKAYDQYWIYSIVCVLSAVAFLVTVLLLCSLLKYLNGGYAVSKFNREDERAERILQKEQAEVERSALLPLKVIAAVSAAVSALAPFASTLSLMQTAAGGSSSQYRMANFLASFGAAYGVIDGIVALIFACVLARAAYIFKQRLESKLMLE